MDKDKLNTFNKIILESIELSSIIPFFPGTNVLKLILKLSHSNKAIEDKIQVAIQSLQETTTTITELEDIINQRTKKLISMREEYERLSKLSEIKKEEAEAFIKQLQFAVDENATKEIFVNILINLSVSLVILVIGIMISPYIKGFFGIQ